MFKNLQEYTSWSLITKPLLPHRKAALTFLLRADLQQWSVNYGDSCVGFSNGNPFAFTTTSITASVDVYKWDSLRNHSFNWILNLKRLIEWSSLGQRADVKSTIWSDFRTLWHSLNSQIKSQKYCDVFWFPVDKRYETRGHSGLHSGVYKPKTEDQRPKTEDRRPKTEGRRPKTKNRRPKTEDRRPKTEDRKVLKRSFRCQKT